jgi:hypothetical protein
VELKSGHDILSFQSLRNGESFENYHLSRHGNDGGNFEINVEGFQEVYDTAGGKILRSVSRSLEPGSGSILGVTLRSRVRFVSP